MDCYGYFHICNFLYDIQEWDNFGIGSWTSTIEIIINIDGLAVGSYNFTIIAADGYSSYAIDTVIVTVTLPSNDNQPNIPGYNLIILIGIICISTALLRKKLHHGRLGFK